MPRPASHSVIFALASATPRPSSEISSLAELTLGPSYEANASSHPQGPSAVVGRLTTQRMGSSKARANAKSRSSCAGTAMIAPVP